MHDACDNPNANKQFWRREVIATFRPYPAYRDAGIHCMGRIPAHWNVRRLKHVCSQFALYGANIPAIHYKTEGVRFLRTTDITDDGLLTEQGVFLPDGLVRKYMLNDNDILISRSGTVGRSLLYKKHLHGPCSYAGYLVRFALEECMSPEYVFYFTKTEAFSEFLSIASISSTIENVNAEKYANMYLTIPPFEEQKIIAMFLTNSDEAIRKVINLKLELIRFLEEKRRATINHVVTHGLAPTVPLRPSGIEWLGEVPVHWTLCRLRNSCLMRVSNVDKHKRDDEVPVRLCNYVDVYKNDRIHSEHNFMHATATRDEIKQFRLRRGDVLITKDSETWDDIGVPALVEDTHDDLLCGYHLALLRPFPKHLNGTYLFYALRSDGVSRQFHIAANGVTRFGLSHNAIKSVWLPIPPVAEQVAIASFLDRECFDIDKAIEAAQREILLLNEYRTRLIADVVTGKLDVREAVNYTQEESDEPNSTNGEDARRRPAGDIGSEAPETET